MTTPHFWILWFGYGLAAAALAYTHNYALLTIAAQLAFVMIYLLGLPRRGADGPVLLVGFAFAIGLLLVLYSPWLPILQAQTAEVGQGFWIPPLSLDNMALDLKIWLFGDSSQLPHRDILGAAVLPSIVVLVIALTAFRPSCWVLFAGIAAAPWIATGLFYWATGNSVLQPRYLVLGQVGLFLLLGTLAGQFAPTRGVPFLASLYLAVVATNGVAYVVRAPSESPSLAEMAHWLRAEHRNGDVVLVSNLREVTRVQYYLSRTKIDSLDIRTPASLARAGHTVHLASLTASNLLYDWESLATGTRQLWHISWSGHSAPYLHGWRLIESREFDSHISVGCFYLDNS